MDKDILKLIDVFIKASIESWDAEQTANSRKYNKCSDKIRKAYVRLKERDKTKELFKLMNHEHQSVRSNAAFYLIPEFPEESRGVLVETSKLKQCWLGINAKVTLDLWEKGELWILKGN